MKGARSGLMAWGELVGMKWRELYLNNNKKEREREKSAN